MRLIEIATQVRIVDRERPYYYWVTVSRPEKAKAAALKKHRITMGMAPDQGEMVATVVDKPVPGQVDPKTVKSWQDRSHHDPSLPEQD